MKRTHHGFSLIEVLIAMVVMALGLIAIATFQTDLLSSSGTNKARSEALSLAQAKLDELRNYANETEFASSMPVGTSAAEAIDGINAEFSRTVTIADGSDGDKTLTVLVTWSDRLGKDQEVTLSSVVSWSNPEEITSLGYISSSPLVHSPTGKAHLGEGTLILENYSAPAKTDNGDGTFTVDDGSGDLKLVLDEGAGADTIVLTLEEACQLSSCIGFVEISGIVYIDTATQNTLQPGDVYIKASDAAYCHRFYTDSGGTIQNVETTTTTGDTPETSPNGDYEYFNYTCYLGGGWHGNIGVLFSAGISQNDKICQGDPTLSVSNTYAGPVIAARRAYRGMIYKIDTSTASGRQEYDPTPNDGVTNNEVRYYSMGIADQTILPDTTNYQYDSYGNLIDGDASTPGVQPVLDTSDDRGHDFVIAKLSPSQTTGDYCIGASAPMTRGDANINGTDGDFFTGVPADFVCLNTPTYDLTQSYAYSHTDFGIDSSGNNINDLFQYGFNNGDFNADMDCPYDPTDPPVESHLATGAVTVTGDPTLDVSLAYIRTSDGDGNCWPTSSPIWNYDSGAGEWTASYACRVYDWGSGWLGYIEIVPNNDKIGCTVDQRTHLVTPETADFGGEDFACLGADYYFVSGEVGSVANNRKLVINTTDSNGLCTPTGASVTTTSDITTTTNYQCRSDALLVAPIEWSGSITYTSTITQGGGGVHTCLYYPSTHPSKANQLVNMTDFNAVTGQSTSSANGDAAITLTFSNVSPARTEFNVRTDNNNCSSTY